MRAGQRRRLSAIVHGSVALVTPWAGSDRVARAEVHRPTGLAVHDRVIVRTVTGRRATGRRATARVEMIAAAPLVTIAATIAATVAATALRR